MTEEYQECVACNMDGFTLDNDPEITEGATTPDGFTCSICLWHQAQKMPRYNLIFQDFADDVKQAIKAGLVDDCTYGNDVAPSVCVAGSSWDDKTSVAIHIFCDKEHACLREYKDSKRYCVQRCVGGNWDDDSLIETNDFSEVLELIKKNRG